MRPRLLCFFCVAASASGAGENPPLRVAMAGSYLPLHAFEGGQAIGLEADLARLLAAKLGREVIFLDRPALGMGTLDAVAAGKADVALSAITPTPERAAKVDFTAPYATLRFRLLGRTPVTTLRKGSKVATIGGASKAAAALRWEFAVTEALSMADALKSLKAGKVDFVAGEDIAVVTALVKDLKNLRLVGEPFGRSPIAMAVPKGEAQKLDGHLQELEDELLRLHSRWKLELPDDDMARLTDCLGGSDGACAWLSRWKSSAPARFTAECKKGDLVACVGEGRFYEGGYMDGDTPVMIRADLARAVRAYQKACDGGEPMGCCYLGARHGFGGMGAHDPSKALAVLKPACEAGDGCSCRELGSLVARKGRAHDPEQAIQLLTRSCEGGDSRACLALGERFSPRDSGTADPKAIRAWIRACDGGSRDACRAAAMHSATNPKQARRLLLQLCWAWESMQCQQLCDQGLQAAPLNPAEQAMACRMAAKNVEAGRAPGEPRTWAENGLRYYDKGCALGDAESCRISAQRYAAGAQVPKDPLKVAEALAQACKLGDGKACRERAESEEDTELRTRFLLSACENRDKPACRTLVEQLEPRAHTIPTELVRAHENLCQHFRDKKSCERATELSPTSLPERSPQ